MAKWILHETLNVHIAEEFEIILVATTIVVLVSVATYTYTFMSQSVKFISLAI